MVGSAKRDVTHPIATVIYNACYHLFRKHLCITVHRLGHRIDCDNNMTPAIYAFEPPFFGVNEQKRLIGYKRGKEAHEAQFPKLQTFSESVELSLRSNDDERRIT